MSDHCATPEWLYKALDWEFRFNLDPCPLAIVPRVDGLSLDWNGKRVFCNPPYSMILPWVRKGVTSSALTVFLVPSRFDSTWSRLLREAGAEMRFPGREIIFKNERNKPSKPFGGTFVAIVRRLHNFIKP